MIYEKIREELVNLGKEISLQGLNLGTWGNISARIDETHFAITPSGIAYNEILPEDIVIMNTAGEIIHGNKKPSIEFPLHQNIYLERANIKAIIHTHSTCCTAFAIARKVIPAVCEDMVQVVGGNVEVAEYFLPGSQELARAVISALGDKTACLMANHGLVAVADSLDEAYKIVKIVEKSAQAIIYAKSLGGAVELDKEDINFMRDFYLLKYKR